MIKIWEEYKYKTNSAGPGDYKKTDYSRFTPPIVFELSALSLKQYTNFLKQIFASHDEPLTHFDIPLYGLSVEKMKEWAKSMEAILGSNTVSSNEDNKRVYGMYESRGAGTEVGGFESVPQTIINNLSEDNLKKFRLLIEDLLKVLTETEDVIKEFQFAGVHAILDDFNGLVSFSVPKELATILWKKFKIKASLGSSDEAVSFRADELLLLKENPTVWKEFVDYMQNAEQKIAIDKTSAPILMIGRFVRRVLAAA